MTKDAMQVSQDKSNTPSQWWRWPLVPFAAVAGALAGAYLFGAFAWFGMKIQGGHSEDGWYYRYILPVMLTGIFGYLYVHIACLVAPRGKRIVGTVMVTLFAVISVFQLIFAWTSTTKSSGDVTQITVSTIVGFVAAIAALVAVHGER